MPEDGDDGFFPTSGNDLVSRKIFILRQIVTPLTLFSFVFRNQRWLMRVGSIDYVYLSVLHQTLHLMRLCYGFWLLVCGLSNTLFHYLKVGNGLIWYGFCTSRSSWRKRPNIHTQNSTNWSQGTSLRCISIARSPCKYLVAFTLWLPFVLDSWVSFGCLN